MEDPLPRRGFAKTSCYFVSKAGGLSGKGAVPGFLGGVGWRFSGILSSPSRRTDGSSVWPFSTLPLEEPRGAPKGRPNPPQGGAPPSGAGCPKQRVYPLQQSAPLPHGSCADRCRGLALLASFSRGRRTLFSIHLANFGPGLPGGLLSCRCLGSPRAFLEDSNPYAEALGKAGEEGSFPAGNDKGRGGF